MNTSQPEADTEYSKTVGGASPPGDHPTDRRDANVHRTFSPLLALALAGAALLVAAEFSPLVHVRTIAAHPRLVRTVQGGPHHGWALLVIAVLAALLAALAGRVGGRPAALMIALLGAGALAITLGVDLHDAHATGLVRSGSATPLQAQAHAAIGLYLETLGAVALLLAGAGIAALDRRG